MSAPEIKVFPADARRGILGLIAIVTMSAGAGAMWGTPAFFIVSGGILTFACIADEMLERITFTKRSAEAESTQ